MIVPNIIRGGKAIPIDKNLFLMKGRKHKNGGIDIGKNLEVEGNEIVQTSPDSIKVFSAQKFLNGESPAQLILQGVNPDKVFKAQENYKDKHGINDDGTKKGKWGFFKRLFGINNNDDNLDKTKTPVKGEDDKKKLLDGDIDFGELAARQLFMESEYKSNSKSNKNAIGLFQIRQNALDDYNRANKTNYTLKDLYDDDLNLKVRNWYFDYQGQRPFATNENNADSVRVAKQLVGYNWGQGNTADYLLKQKEKGIDIYNSWDWLNELPEEPRNYVNFILRNQDVNQYKTNDIYKRTIENNKELYEKVKKEFGGMNKNKNNTSVPSAVGTNRSYLETVKENIQEYYNALKGNPFAEMIFPFKDVSEGNTISILPYIVPGYGVGKVLLRGANKMSKNFNKAAKIVNKEQSKKILRDVSHIEDYEKSKLTDLYLHDNPKQRIESELMERDYKDLEAEMAEEFYYKHGYTIEDLLNGKITNKYGGKHVNKDNAYVLGYQSPFTGDKKFACGGRKKAALGKNAVVYDDDSVHYTTDDDYDETKVNKNKTDIYQGNRILKRNVLLTSGIVSGVDALSGIVGSAINNATNRKYLTEMENLVKGMKAYNVPITKLKTTFNINPQLSEIENQLGITSRDIDSNTASSQVALARKRKARYNALLEKNKLHGIKENIETELINKDKLQQAATHQRNIENQQNIHNTKQQLLANLMDKRSENATATINNITGALTQAGQDFIRGYSDYQKLLAGLSANPNGANAVLGQSGKEIRERKEQKAENKKKRKEQRQNKG